MITVWTDGACTGSGEFAGIGGWAFKLESENVEFEKDGTEINTTNNRMEMEAVVQGLRQILETQHLFNPQKIMFYSDSKLVVETLRKGGTYQQNKNLDKWKEIYELMELLEVLGFDIDFSWVKAHDNKNDSKISQNNKRVDKLASKARDIRKQQVASQMAMFL